MKNIDYLELFFKKHNLNGKVKVKFSSPVTLDCNISDIVFENDDVININDVIFDIESEFPNEIFNQWIEEKRKTGISLMDWIKTNPTKFQENMDTSSVEEFQKEMEEIFDNVKESINKVFEFEEDNGDSEDE